MRRLDDTIRVGVVADSRDSRQCRKAEGHKGEGMQESVITVATSEPGATVHRYDTS